MHGQRVTRTLGPKVRVVSPLHYSVKNTRLLEPRGALTRKSKLVRVGKNNHYFVRRRKESPSTISTLDQSLRIPNYNAC